MKIDMTVSDDKKPKILLNLVMVFCMVILINVSWQDMTRGIESDSAIYLDETFEKAGTAFLIARALNATISVAQSFTITPFVGELTIGEILDPINDIIERFSWVMLVVTVSIGTQKLLMEIGVSIDLTLIALSTLVLIWISFFIKTSKTKNFLRAAAYKLLIIMFLIRFAIPITGFLGSQISPVFLDDKREDAMQAISASKARISDIESTAFVTSPKDSVAKLEEQSKNIVNQIITLITLFLLESILFPLLILWILSKLFSTTIPITT